MSRVIKHNWVLVTTLAIVFIAIGSWNMIPIWIASSAQGNDSRGDLEYPAAGTADQDGARASEEMAAYSRVQSLRQRLALTTRDMAAIGCSQETAERVLVALMNWERRNEGIVEQRRSASRQAGQRLTEVQRQINVGPRNASLIAQVLGLEREFNATKLAEVQLLDEVAIHVGTLLDAEQSTLWAKARSSLSQGGLSRDQYRFAGALTAEQASTLETAQRRSLGRSAANGTASVTPLAMVQDQLFDASQRQSLESASSNAALRLDDVLRAEMKVFPTGHRLTSTPDANQSGVP